LRINTGERKMSDKYNGWTNYETWKISLELVNYDHLAEVIEDFAPDNFQGFIDYVEEVTTEHAHEGTAGNSFASAVLDVFLDSVNWQEIAEHAQVAYT
jgi:hypothetical protein